MADVTLTALVTPSNQITYCTRAGVPYRGDDSNIVYAPAGDVVELTALGFSQATGTQVPPGDPLTFDTGWSLTG